MFRETQHGFLDKDFGELRLVMLYRIFSFPLHGTFLSLCVRVSATVLFMCLVSIPVV